VHPYQLAYADPKVPAEVWADDVDTWMASPYAPQGVAKPVDGGYIFNGRWQFSSGTDHCDWIILGAMLGDDQCIPVMPPQMLHMILPRKDYEIVDDSWNVVGLRGTGSKDVIVKDAFVPAYRTMDATKVMDGTAQREAGMTEPLYLMPWSTMFPLGISAATIGIAEGALAAHLDYQRERVAATGTAIKDDPYVMYAIGEAAADINAARQELLANADRIYDIVASGKEVSFADRAAGRRTQVRAVWQCGADGQTAAALLARCACRPRACHSCPGHHLPRVGAELAGHRSARGSAAGADLGGNRERPEKSWIHHDFDQ
jgi:3-hydroxy-9,10-secoandrosta-1,3,5(10)-triene-9,17-dione monooxygenase